MFVRFPFTCTLYYRAKIKVSVLLYQAGWRFGKRRLRLGRWRPPSRWVALRPPGASTPFPGRAPASAAVAASELPDGSAGASVASGSGCAQ